MTTDPRAWIAQEQAVADAATPGPWESGANGGGRGWVEAGVAGDYRDVVGVETVGHGHMRENVSTTTAADAAFIAHARTGYPLALAALTAVLDLCEDGQMRAGGIVVPVVSVAHLVRAITTTLGGQ